MDETTIRRIYMYSVSLAGIILVWGSLYYFRPISHTPSYIVIAIALLIIPLLAELWADRPTKD